MSAEANTPSLVTRLVRFAKDDRGSVTIEFTLLLPLFTAFLLLVTDASLLFLRQTTLMNVARDTARAVSRYAMTAAEAKTYAETVAKTGQGAATATVTVANGIVTVNITTPDAAGFRRSETQVASMLARAVGRGRRGL